MSWLSRRTQGRNEPSVPTPKKRRRLLVCLLGLPVCALLPATVFQLALYRSNLAVAQENRPLATPLKKSDRLLIISPHCDDETLGAGGVMAAAHKTGARVQVVFITNGDGSGSTQIVAQARELREQVNLKALLGGEEKSPQAKKSPSTASASDTSENLFQRIAAMRRREAIAACVELGVAEKDVLFLGYPDGGTQAMWEQNWSAQAPFTSPYTKTSRSPYEFSFTRNASYNGAQVVSDLEKIIEEFQPTVVMTTHPADTHPDHWAAYGYSAAALERLRLGAGKSASGVASQPKLLTFLVHHGFWPVPHGYQPEATLAPPASLQKSGTRWLVEPLTVEARDTKKTALEKYTSQLVFTPHYLRAFVRRNELFGEIPIVSNAKPVTQTAKLLTDSPSDSSWRDSWPAADIETLNYQVAPQTLTLQANLAGAPSARVHYRFVLHSVTSTGVSNWTVEARREGSQLQATLISRNGDQKTEKLQGTLTANGFKFAMPRSTLEVVSVPSTLLVSGATSVGRTRLDQTPTAMLRIQ